VSRHVFLAFDQMVTVRQQAQITEKVEVFHQEHLAPIVFECSIDEIDWEFVWISSNEVRIDYDVETSGKQDLDINRQLLRYLEISVIPMVFYGDDVPIQLTSHDNQYDESCSYDCVGCDSRYENYKHQNVLSTSKVYADNYGA